MTDDLGIKPEWREAWAQAQYWREAAKTVGDVVSVDLANLSLHLCGKLLESEFRREHREWNDEFRSGCVVCHGKLDPRHDYDWPRWIDVARKFLSERCDDEKNHNQK